jgi:hypothetical protein
MTTYSKGNAKNDSKNEESSIIISRGGQNFMVKVAFADNESGAEMLHSMAVHHRCFSDAVDMLLYLRETVKNENKKTHNGSLDMKKFRKICMSKGEKEESLMIILLGTLIQTEGWKIRNLGFPLGDDNEPISTDELTIHFETK